MLDRIINIFFLFALIFIFILVAKLGDHLRISVAVLLSIFCVLLAFVLNWLTLDGATSAILFGTIAFGLGSYTGAATVLTFFISSSLLSKDLIIEEGFEGKKFRRDGLQVWSNGFWFAFWLIIWFTTKAPGFLVAAVTCMAFATSDTWASEVGGTRVKGKTWLVTDFKEVKPGTDGGVSVIGSVAAFSGAALIALIFWALNPEEGLVTALLIAFSGFVGCFVDSWFGAAIQGKKLHAYFKNLFAGQVSIVDNNMVNWMAGGSASIIALILILLVGS